jgi:hypothetical protein
MARFGLLLLLAPLLTHADEELKVPPHAHAHPQYF